MFHYPLSTLPLDQNIRKQEKSKIDNYTLLMSGLFVIKLRLINEELITLTSMQIL